MLKPQLFFYYLNVLCVSAKPNLNMAFGMALADVCYTTVNKRCPCWPVKHDSLFQNNDA